MNSEKFVSDILKRDSNNFDVLRLIAAFGVIIGHAYAIAPQPPLQDGVLSLLHFDYSGSLAVKFFFFLSGLLVTNSIISKPNAFYFLVKRAFRIFPGLLVCLLISVFIIGPIFTNLSLGTYFFNTETWNYLIKNFTLLDIQWKLPGVFSDSKFGLNGSLWTLPYEVLCYIYLATFYGLGLLKNKLVSNIFFSSIVAVSFLAPNYLPVFFAQNPESHLLPACFAIGALFANNKKIIPVNSYQIILIWLLVFLLKNSAVYQFLFYIALFYSTIFISSLEFVRKYLKLPFDASYGVYVYGFMIQQCIHYLFPTMGVYGNQIITSILALFIGILSWYFVEKRFIDVSNKISDIDFSLLFKKLSNYSLEKMSFFKISKSNGFALIILSIIALITHAIVLKFIFPGYYSPLYPQHSDFYIPAYFANTTVYSFINFISFPRPVTTIFSAFIGHFGIRGSIACVIAVVCLNCSLAALLIKRIFELPFNLKFLFLFFIYCFLIFSQPYFYTFYAQDIGAQLSFFFLILGTYIFYLTFNRSVFISGSLLFIFCLLAFLSKETYGLAALVFALLWFIYYRKESLSKAISPCLTVFSSLFIAFAYNIYIKSSFINVDSPDSPYSISLNPAILLPEIFLYLKEALNFANLLMMIVLCYLVFKYKNKKEFFFITIGCCIALLASIVPNALLPNHHYKGYSFNGAYLFYLPLIFLSSFWIAKNITKKFVIAIVLLSLFSPILNIRKYKDDTNSWILAQENTQRNLLKAIRPLIDNVQPSNPPQKILIEGITFPFHPFAFPDSLRVFPNAKYANFDVVNYNNPSLTNNQQMDLVRFISPSDTGLINYDEKWIFNEDGSLKKSVNLTPEKVTDLQSTSVLIEINQDNFPQYITSGFYAPENGIRWANGNASINLINNFTAIDSVDIILFTSLPPVCKDIIPKISLIDNDNKEYQSISFKKEGDKFSYKFHFDKSVSIQKINILSETIDASPDQRTLSFPFISLEIKK